MGHIFISYSHKDKDYVHKLQEALRNEGFDVWIDDRIDYGTEWPKVIQEHLDECDAFIVVVSENAYNSKWVQNELTRAERKKKPIFPLLLHGDTWLSVETTQYVNVKDQSLPTEKFFQRVAEVTSRGKKKLLLREAGRTPNLYGTSITVTRLNIEFFCNLPLGLGNRGGDGKIIITTSSKSIVINLPRKVILGELMKGLNSPIAWSARPYLCKTNNDGYEVNIGQTDILLLENEAMGLCECIDEVCTRYKKILLQTENSLDARKYPPIEYEGIYGFKLIRIKKELWELMHRFSVEFDYANGKTKWNIFAQQNIRIRVCHGLIDNIFMWPVPEINSFDNLPTGNINVLYEVDDSHLEETARLSDRATWQECVGEEGIWTAEYAKEWLRNRFIPKVLEYYKKEIVYKGNYLIEDYKVQMPTLSTITKLEELAYYLETAQSWFLDCQERIPSNLIEPFYRAFIAICSNTDSALDYEYINKKLNAANGSALYSKDVYNQFKSRAEIISTLVQHLNRVSKIGYEDSETADNISRIFLSIIRSKVRLQQNQLDDAKKALEPLLQEYQFSQNYILPNAN
jgi:hypothetical protein